MLPGAEHPQPKMTSPHREPQRTQRPQSQELEEVVFLSLRPPRSLRFPVLLDQRNATSDMPPHADGQHGPLPTGLPRNKPTRYIRLAFGWSLSEHRREA